MQNGGPFYGESFPAGAACGAAAGAAHLYRRRAESVLHRQRVRVQLYRQRAAPVPAGGRFGARAVDQRSAQRRVDRALPGGGGRKRDLPVPRPDARRGQACARAQGRAGHAGRTRPLSADHGAGGQGRRIPAAARARVPAGVHRRQHHQRRGRDRRQTGGGLGQRLFQRGAPLCPPDGRGAGRGMAHHQPERLGAAVRLGQRPPPPRDGLLRAGLRCGGRRAQRRAGRAAAV